MLTFLDHWGLYSRIQSAKDPPHVRVMLHIMQNSSHLSLALVWIQVITL